MKIIHWIFFQIGVLVGIIPFIMGFLLIWAVTGFTFGVEEAKLMMAKMSSRRNHP